MSRLAPPQLSFADLELQNQGVHLDPLLQSILAFLDAMPRWSSKCVRIYCEG